MDNPIFEDLLRFVQSETYRPILERILAYEDKVMQEGGWYGKDENPFRPPGWEWFEVQVAPGYLAQLAHAGIIGIVHRSNKHTEYRLTDTEAVRRALAAEATDPSESPPGWEPSDPDYVRALRTMFEPIIGFEDVKDLFHRALASPRPVHLLLEGPPASAKTMFLMELARLPRAHFLVGGSTTKAGLADALLLFRPRYLLLDEIETIGSPRDYSVLLHLMENQEVVETKYRRHNRVPLRTWVFAAGNDVSKLPVPLLSRFGGPSGVIRFRVYTASEFADVATRVLEVREGVPLEFAREVANASLDLGSRDVRMAIRLARLGRDREGLRKVAEAMRRRR